jgi:hypothetical protein
MHTSSSATKALIDELEYCCEYGGECIQKYYVNFLDNYLSKTLKPDCGMLEKPRNKAKYGDFS